MHRQDNGRPPRRLLKQIVGRVDHRGAAVGADADRAAQADPAALVVTVRPDTSCRELAVTVHNGIVTLEGEPGSAVLGAGIAGRVEHLEGVVAVRNRFVYPARSAPSFPSDPGL